MSMLATGSADGEGDGVRERGVLSSQWDGRDASNQSEADLAADRAAHLIAQRFGLELYIAALVVFHAGIGTREAT